MKQALTTFLLLGTAVVLTGCFAVRSQRESFSYTDSWELRGEPSPLHLAASTGDVAKCSALIAAGTDVNAATDDGWTPLHVACNNKHGDVVRLLIKNGARGNVRDRYDITPLHRAMRGWWNWRTDRLPVLDGGDTLTPHHSDSEEQMAPSLAKDGAAWTEVVRLLVSHDAEANAKDCRGDTPLNYLLYQLDCFWPLPGNTKVAESVARILIGRGADVRNKGGFMRSPPLYQACNWRSPDGDATNLVRLLLGAGASVHDRDKQGRAAMHFAYGPLVELFLELGADVNARDRNGNIPIVHAAWAGQVETAFSLMSHGANIRARYNNSDHYLRELHNATLLHLAARTRRGTNLCTRLIDSGLSVHARDSNGNTPLHCASKRNNRATCRLLLARGSEVDARNGVGRTPLHLAACNVDYWRDADIQRQGTFRSLLAAGAEANAQDTEGNTPLHLAAKNCQPAALEQLLAGGANINATNRLGQTPLHTSVHRGGGERAVVWQYLLERGADVNAKDAHGKTPLHLAMGDGPSKLLLENGADPNARDERGRTPLHGAASTWRNPGCYKLLIDHGADPNARDDDGNTPLSLAKEYGEAQIIRELVACGATD